MYQVTLKAARVNAGLSQTEAAQAVSVSKHTIIKWERGETAPTAWQFKELCNLYRVPMDNIFLPHKFALSEQS